MTNDLHNSRQTVVLHWSLTRTPRSITRTPHRLRLITPTGMQRSWLIMPLVHVPPAPCSTSAGPALQGLASRAQFLRRATRLKDLIGGIRGIDVSAMTHTIPLHRRQDTQRWAPLHLDPDTGNYRAMTECRVDITQSKSLSPPSFDGPRVQLI
jgi:hypothetical protein